MHLARGLTPGDGLGCGAALIGLAGRRIGRHGGYGFVAAILGELAIARLKSLSEKTRATNLLTWFNIGTVPHAAVKEAMEQFAVEVMPELRA